MSREHEKQGLLLLTQAHLIHMSSYYCRDEIGLRPQHIKDMTAFSAGESGSFLLKALTSFVQFVLDGEVLHSVRPSFFAANLTALKKKDKGVCPIAVGCTLQRLTSKCASSSVTTNMSTYCPPSIGVWSQKRRCGSSSCRSSFSRNSPK